MEGGAAAGAMRLALLRQLLVLDWDYRRRAGDEPHAGDYQPRLPGDRALIEEVGREMSASPDSTRLQADGPHALNTPWSSAEPPHHVGQPAVPEDTASACYDLLHEVGHGGIGVVFRGRDRLLGRELAVKVLCEAYRDNPEARRRFTEEARVGSQLQHPAIVPVYELGCFSDRRPYLTMKLVEGHTFALAGCGRGKGDPTLSAMDQAHWRQEAFAWLRNDLAFWADRLDKNVPHVRPVAQRALERWQMEKALAGIREPEELAGLPEAERARYLRFWADVQELLVRCLASRARL